MTTTPSINGTKTMNRTHLLAALVGVSVLGFGCAQPELIDRTQPNYVKKSDLLDSVWYIQESVIDAPKTPNGTAVIGYGGKMEKVRWEIQENLLVGYRSYEVVPGADPRVDRQKSKLGKGAKANHLAYIGDGVIEVKWRQLVCSVTNCRMRSACSV